MSPRLVLGAPSLPASRTPTFRIPLPGSSDAFLCATIDARYGEALKAWETRIVDYVGRRDENTTELAKHLDQLQRRDVDAERMLDLAAARKPLPTDHPTSALAYRVRELVTPRKHRRAPSIDPYPRVPQQDSGPRLGM